MCMTVRNTHIVPVNSENTAVSSENNFAFSEKSLKKIGFLHQKNRFFTTKNLFFSDCFLNRQKPNQNRMYCFQKKLLFLFFLLV